jgi:hypothetical protein
MKRGFIRGLWGIFDKSHRITNRRYSIENDIKDILNNKFGELFKTYVFGKENYDGLRKMGVEDCDLFDEKPFMFDLIKHQYRHKMEIIKYAMENDGYDELVYLDWDCVPQKKINPDFWDELNKKASFQANLQLYHRKKCGWRAEDQRKVPNGGFIYLRDKTLPSLAIQYWEKLKMPDNDEPAWAKVTDEIVGGWKGAGKYWELFEPMCCNLRGSSPYPKELLLKKDVCFIHYQG